MYKPHFPYFLDDELNALLKLREIQDKVVTLRTETPPIYGKYLKEEASLLLKNVVRRYFGIFI